MSWILCTIDCIWSVWVVDYISCLNGNKHGYMIKIVNNNYVKNRKATETRKIDLWYVRRNRLCVFLLAGIQLSIDHSIYWYPSTPKDKRKLDVANMSNNTKELITILK